MHVLAVEAKPTFRLIEDASSLGKAAEIFTSLSNAIRLGVLVRVLEREWSVNELAAELKISQSALSQHLGKLRQARIVQVRRQSQSIFYRCNDELVLRLLTEAGLLRR